MPGGTRKNFGKAKSAVRGSSSKMGIVGKVLMKGLQVPKLWSSKGGAKTGSWGTKSKSTRKSSKNGSKSRSTGKRKKKGSKRGRRKKKRR